MTNKQFTDALAAKSAQLHVGLDNSIRVAFEAGAMWAKGLIEAKEPNKFRQGDRVCTDEFGSGTIIRISPSQFNLVPIEVAFDNLGNPKHYTMEGAFFPGHPQTLFHID